jgi:hypothetical protein
MAAEIERIFAEEDLRKTGEEARRTIPLSWENLIPMVQERYQTVIERVKSELHSPL